MPQDRALSRKVGRTAFRRVALGAAALALSVCSYASLARAGDADAGDSNQSFTDKFLTTLGLKNPFAEQYGINYSERSPLVVPPTRNLPPPVASGLPPAPNWPKDPDVVKRKAAKGDDKTGPFPNAVLESERVLRPDELMRNGSTKSKPATTTDQSIPPPDGAHKNIFSWINPNKEEYATFTGEPARASLTDPPAGYLTPSPDQPYGIGKERAKYKIPTVADRMEPTR
jgi:hypothetical protein